MKQPKPRRKDGRVASREPRPDTGGVQITGPAPVTESSSDSLAWLDVLQLGDRLLLQDADAGSAHAQVRAQHRLICETTAQLLDAEIDLWLSRQVLPAFAKKPSAFDDADLQHFLPEPQLPLMQQALQQRQIELEPLSLGDSDAGVATSAAMPLLASTHKDGEVLGVLYARRPSERPLDANALALLQGIGSQVATALRASRQAFAERWRVEQLDLVRLVNTQVANARNVDELARRVTELIEKTFNYYYVAIFTLESGQEVLHFRASASSRHAQQDALAQPDFNPSPSLVVRLGEGMIGKVAETGQEILANMVECETSFRFLEQLPETRSEVSLPLKTDGQILGVLDVQSDQPNEFTEVDMMVLRALASNISLALESIRLYSALRRRAEQLTTISEVSRAITSILDQEELLGQVVSLLRKRFGFSYVYIFSVHSGRRKIFYEAGSLNDSHQYRDAGFSLDLDEPDGIIPWVARHGDTVVANDITTEPRYHALTLPPDTTLAEMAVPLIFGGEVLGVLDIQSEFRDVFSAEDRFVFEAMADSIAVALRNSSLYRSEIWRRQVADSMREIASLLSADVSLPQMLESILEELERSLPCDLVAVWLLDDEEEYPDAGESIPPLRLAALRGAEQSWMQLKGLSLQELNLHNADVVNTSGSTRYHSLLTEALNSDTPVIRSDQWSFDPLGAALGYGDEYSAIIAPLRVADQNLGLLSLVHRSPGRYGSEARSMTAAFANYAAVAIQNARLYEAAHDQAWVSTALLQVAQATQSLTNLNELLNTVARITPMLVGVIACAIYLYDDNEVFVPVSASGLSSGGLAEFERWRFGPGDIPALDQVLSERSAVILHSANGDSRLERIFIDELDDASPASLGVITLVPMLARGDVQGAFLIHYHMDTRDVLTSENFFEETLLTVQGIAHQAAVAAENIRLLKTQKEEAYVSVALLQVAQAIVSSNDLEEILGSIVRITPILVGVRRTVLFVWDDARQVFWLSQEYGLPRGSEWSFYEPGEFPLLDAVVGVDELLALPQEVDLSDEDALDEWLLLEPPTSEETEIYLQGLQRLLLAFPLSIKGTVLGVLLVEEPVKTSENLVGGSSLRRLREKRLEITTGISQQAALAIQNDHLQGETVKRERLEREMQLAREIQYTFLPQRVPQLSGWDLSMRWRTAREVGGDFYDFFEIPARNGFGPRLGLVIADVADKGMPAALFMVLVRTLMRAAALDLDDPADVLKRVNGILLPDAKNGMFVTLVYAVVNLEDGSLVYANAGHNPPILWHSRAASLDLLVRSGVALGVVEDDNMGQNNMQLQPGDYLMLYTDGISESFSPEGEMFGDSRIAEIIQEAVDSGSLAAEGVLDAVESVLGEFVGDLPLADDLTLLCLRRSLQPPE